MKSLASSMLMVWMLCWAHCSLSRYGVVMGSDACVCCTAAHEHAEDDHDSPSHTELTCGVCDFLTHGATLMQKLPPVDAVVVGALMPDSCGEPAWLPVMIAEDLTLAVAHDPPRVRELCELLSGEMCPVRGPTVG